MASEERKALLLRIDPDLWNELERGRGRTPQRDGQNEYLLRKPCRNGNARRRPMQEGDDRKR